MSNTVYIFVLIVTIVAAIALLTVILNIENEALSDRVYDICASIGRQVLPFVGAVLIICGQIGKLPYCEVAGTFIVAVIPEWNTMLENRKKKYFETREIVDKDEVRG